MWRFPGTRKTKNELMKKFVPVILACGISAMGITAVDAAGVLVDPGFEAGPLVDDGSGVGKWQPFSAGTSTSMIAMTNPRSGAGHLELTLGAANEFAGVFQDVPVAAGELITYSLWHLATDNSPSAIEIRIEWRDSVGDTEISRTANSTPSPGTSYELFSLAETVPAGADTARVVYAIQSFGGNPAAVINVDDASVVPEPATGIFAALGMMGFAARRRRG